VMPVNPGFRIIDDVEGPNAFAMPRTIVVGTTGTVLLGISLLKSEITLKYGGYAAAGIGAHECAHIYQFFSDIGSWLAASQAAVKPFELHAGNYPRLLIGGAALKG
jgi:hypothetical protein